MSSVLLHSCETCEVSGVTINVQFTILCRFLPDALVFPLPRACRRRSAPPRASPFFTNKNPSMQTPTLICTCTQHAAPNKNSLAIGGRHTLQPNHLTLQPTSSHRHHCDHLSFFFLILACEIYNFKFLSLSFISYHSISSVLLYIFFNF